MKKLITLIILALLGFFGWNWFQQNSSSLTSRSDSANNTVQQQAINSGDNTQSAEEAAREAEFQAIAKAQAAEEAKKQAMQELRTKQEAAKGALEAPENVAKAPANAERTASGLASLVLQKGTGSENPTATSNVEVHYTGWKTDGTMFDSSVPRGKTATFPLNRVIKGWTEGVQLMVEGEKRRFWIPEDLAYGPGGRLPGTLVFDVELVDIK